MSLYIFLSKRFSKLLFCSVPFLFGFLFLVLPPLACAEFEKPQNHSAKDILKAELLKGKHFTVEDEVVHDGLFFHYRVSSPFGSFKEVSTVNLKQLVHEIEVIAVMKQVETDETAIQSLKQSGKNTVSGIQNLFSNPEETLQGAASGVSSLFNRAVNTVGNRQPTGAEDSRAQQLIGFSKSKGEIAKKYGVNVYSGNKVLQAELDRLAWADYLGGLGVGAATSSIPGMGGLVLATSGTARLLNEVINTTPASELWLQNKNKLIALGMNGDTVELFLNNRAYNPALATISVAALERMKNVGNLELFLKEGLQASDTLMAQILTTITVMTAGYHEKIAPLKQILPLARITKAEAQDGTWVVLLPTDYLIWSEMVAGLARLKEDESNTQNKAAQLWVLGDISPTAGKNLEEIGWVLQTRVQKKLMPQVKK